MDNPENISAWSLESLLKEGMKVCEIGIRSGQSSEMFLEKGCFVYLIDPWAEYANYKDETYNTSIYESVYENDYQATLQRIKRYEGKYLILREKSKDATKKIPDDLDFVYIDGNHETTYVANDVYNYWNKLKPGGYLTGDDWAMSSVMSGILKGFSKIVAKNNINQFNIIYWGRNWIVKKP